MLESERRALVELEEAILRKRREGKIHEAVRLMEHGLELRVRVFGPESLHVQKSCKELSDALNGLALKYLQDEQHEEALAVLRKAEVLTGPNDLVTAVTYNNLACYYRRSGKLRTALQYLQKALKIETRAKVVVNPAGTRLNLCAVLSQLGRHQQALEQAQASVILLQEELVSHAATGDAGDDISPELLNKMAVLAISYHNLGVEQEYLKRPEACLESYQKGVEIAQYYLGEENDITRTLVTSHKAASRNLTKLAASLKSHKKPPKPPREPPSHPSVTGVYRFLEERQKSSSRPESAQHRDDGASVASSLRGSAGRVRPMSAMARTGGSVASSSRPSSALERSRQRPASASPYYQPITADALRHSKVGGGRSALGGGGGPSLQGTHASGLPYRMLLSPRDLPQQEADAMEGGGRKGPRSPPPDGPVARPKSRAHKDKEAALAAAYAPGRDSRREMHAARSMSQSRQNHMVGDDSDEEPIPLLSSDEDEIISQPTKFVARRRMQQRQDGGADDPGLKYVMGLGHETDLTFGDRD